MPVDSYLVIRYVIIGPPGAYCASSLSSGQNSIVTVPSFNCSGLTIIYGGGEAKGAHE